MNDLLHKVNTDLYRENVVEQLRMLALNIEKKVANVYRMDTYINSLTDRVIITIELEALGTLPDEKEKS